jgi:two-component system, OmpR family, phosphate regulon response regulator PhoB
MANAYKVLVIDDDPQFIDLMQSLLTAEGYEVASCTRGAESHALAREVQPDVVTLDLRMPDLSGWEVLQQLRSDPDLRRIPVLVISAAGAELAETHEKLRDLGYHDVNVLVKPFEIDELLGRLADAVLDRRGDVDNSR